MDIRNSGTIKLNKPLTQEALDALLKEEEGIVEDLGIKEGDADIEFCDYCDSELDSTLESVIETLSPLDYVLNGSVDYYGNYDGKTFVTDNVVESASVESLWEYEASDEHIIEVLEKRGYKVTKIA